MKTLTKENLSLYIIEDSANVSMGEDYITVGDPVELIISDCNSNNTVLHEGVTPPEDWVGHKYFFDGTTWTVNPDWVDPVEETEAEAEQP